MTIGQRIRNLRIKKHFTQDDLADLLSMKRPTIANYEADRIKPSMKVIDAIADILSTNTEYLLGRNDDPSPKLNSITRKIPLVGTICAGEGLLAEQNIEELIYFPFTNKPQPQFALKVKGDSMIRAGIDNGDIVYMREAKWAEYNGQIVCAIINGEDGVLKRIKWYEGSPVIKLLPENNEFDAIEVYPHELSICGVYAGHFKPDPQI